MSKDSAEHHLAREARRELVDAVRRWVLSLGTKTLNAEELTLREKFIQYDKLKRITGRYSTTPKPEESK